MAKLAQRQVVAEIEPVATGGRRGPRFTGAFAQVSGGEITAPVEKAWDGGRKFPDPLCAPSEISDVTVTRHYDPTRDGSSLGSARQLVGQARYNIKVYDLDCDLVVAGTERVYPNALLVGLSEPDGDSASGAPATFALTFSIGTVAAQ